MDEKTPKPLDGLVKRTLTEAPAAVPATESVLPEAPEIPIEPEIAALEQSFDELFPEPQVILDGPPSWVWWVLFVTATSALIFLGFSLSRQKFDTWLGVEATLAPSASASATATPATPSPTATPTPATPTPSVLPSSVTLRVLNGTRQAGAAGTARTTLQQAGFTVSSVGNARNQNYTQTYVYYQSGRKAEAELVAQTLKTYEPVLEESTLANPDMVLVVVGP